jgi:hypothetical protein
MRRLFVAVSVQVCMGFQMGFKPRHEGRQLKKKDIPGAKALLHLIFWVFGTE